MAWEWVAPTASGAALVATSTSAYLVVRRTTRHTEQMTKIAAQSDLDLTREERIQKRRGDAYIEVLTMAGRIAQWAAMTHPSIQLNIQPDPPPLPSFDEQNRARALITAYGSNEVGALYDSLFDAVRDFQRTLMDLAAAQEARDDGDRGAQRPIEVWGQLEKTARPAVQDAYRALGDRIGVELAGGS